jgi:hypothetical protein
MSYQELCLIEVYVRGPNKGMPLNCTSSYKHRKCRCDNCIEKNRILSEDFRKNNPEKHQQFSRNWGIKNPEKKKEIHDQWYKKNSQQHIKNVTNWQNNNPGKKKSYAIKTQNKRRAVKKMSSHVPYTVEEVLLKYSTCCHVCKKEIDFNLPRSVGKLGWENSFHIDHLIPISKGGNDTIENVRPSHGLCNLRKGSSL